MDALDLAIRYRNARFRAARELGIPLAGGWRRVKARDGSSDGAFLDLACAKCGDIYRYGVNEHDLDLQEWQAADIYACKHLKAIEKDFLRLKALVDLELLVG